MSVATDPLVCGEGPGWGCLRFVSAGECYGNYLPVSGGDWRGQQAGERRALRLAARCPGIPLAEVEEVERDHGEDVAEVDLRTAPIARAPQAAAADPAGEGARGPDAKRIRRADSVGRLTPPRGAQGLELRAWAQAQRPAGRAALGTATRRPARARPAVLARELDPDQVSARRIGALPPVDARPPDRAGPLVPLPVELEIVEREVALRLCYVA